MEGEGSTSDNVPTPIASVNLAIEELFRNKAYADEVVKYCCSVYPENKHQTLEQTTTYMRDTLGAVASHITVVASNLTHYLSLQEKQLEGLELEVESVQQRLCTTHKDLARNAQYLKPRVRNRCKPSNKMFQVQSQRLPRNARPRPKFDVSRSIDYSKLNASTPIASVQSATNLTRSERTQNTAETAVESGKLQIDTSLPVLKEPEVYSTSHKRGNGGSTTPAPPPPPVPSRRSSPPPIPTRKSAPPKS